MAPEHIVPIEPVRAYLLGKLGDQAAGELEERYFTDRSYFLRVQEIETALIRDYLAGRLTRADQRLFEKRYRKVPEMRRKLEEVRQQSGISGGGSSLSWWQPILVAAMLLVCAGTAWFLWHKPALPIPVARAVPDAPRLPFATMLLSPGLQKGGSAAAKEVTLPAELGTLRLVLELPGQAAVFEGAVRISKPGAAETPVPVWTSSGTVRSTPAPGGQVVTVELSSSILSPGEYIVYAIGPDGQTRETYVFEARNPL